MVVAVSPGQNENKFNEEISMSRLILYLITIFFLQSSALADQALAMKSGCAGCHNMDMKTVGPSIKDIAAKHEASNIDELVAIVKKGKSASELTWGTIPMPASPAPEADVRKVIEWMLAH